MSSSVVIMPSGRRDIVCWSARGASVVAIQRRVSSVVIGPITTVPAAASYRLTQASDRRITEAGDARITEP